MRVRLWHFAVRQPAGYTLVASSGYPYPGQLVDIDRSGPSDVIRWYAGNPHQDTMLSLCMFTWFNMSGN